MIDKIVIKNFDYDLSKVKFGKSYVTVESEGGSVNRKYRLFKEDVEIVYLDDGESEEDEGFDVKKRLKSEHALEFFVNDTKGFEIRGSLRKWYYSKGAFIKDLNYIDFLKCISLLAKRTQIPEKVLFRSSIVTAEVGGNILLPSSYKDILSSITAFKGKPKGGYKGTVYFGKKNSRLAFYDKLNEQKDHREKSKNNVDALKKKGFVLRFELQYGTSKKSPYKKELENLNTIKKYWGYLLDEWYRHLDNVTFENKVPPQIPDNKEWLSYTDVNNFLVAYGIKHFGGLDLVRDIVYSKLPKNNRPRDFGKFVKIVAGTEPMDFTKHINVLKAASHKKMNEMKKGYSE